jgi:chorismate mutase
MPAVEPWCTRKRLPTPLHLLDELCAALVLRLERICTDAIAAAESIAAEHEKNCQQTQKKLLKACLKLQSAAMAGKSGAQSRSRKQIAELEDKLIFLKARRAEFLNYIASLRRDTEQCMMLAEDVKAVGQAAREALYMRKVRQAANRAGAAEATTQQ